MGFTNETLHYGIPLPLGSDLTTPMDYNQAAEAVDAAIYQASSDAAGAVSTAGTAQSAAAEAQTAAANAVSDAATAHALADTAVTAASGAQTTAENASTVATSAQTTANALSQIVGTGSLETDAQTIIPAINELHSDIEGVTLATVTSDGVKTFKAIMNELAPHIPNNVDIGRIAFVQGGGEIRCMSKDNTAGYEFSHTFVTTDGSAVFTDTCYLNSTDSKRYRGTSGDISSTVPTAGTVYKIVVY